MAKTYDQFLTTICHCSADCYGNRPCDNGAMCDRCMTKEAEEAWEKFKEEK